MNNFNKIQSKLEQFISKYYTNELIKGVLLFFSIGLLYFLFTLLLEHFLWLSSSARTILFWLFVMVELSLFIFFILLPLAKLFKLKKGINYKEASTIIGNHFPEVNDKLINVLQLKEANNSSELLLASIDQKSEDLTPIPFKLAINFKKNYKYLKYAALPIAIVLFSALFGKLNWFSDSYTRVLNYETAYEAPAPFSFYVLNESLKTIENKAFRLLVSTQGDVVPEDVKIAFNNQTYFLQQRSSGNFEYVFEQPLQNINFSLSGSGITSKPYTLNVIEVPKLLSFDMVLNYPNYINKSNQTIKGIGNAVVPQGTKVSWMLNTKATEAVDLISNDTLAFNKGNAGLFKASKRIYNNLNYTISTSNARLKNFENLAYSISVIKDQYPDLKLEVKTDSIDQQSLYFKGEVSDDYGLTSLQLVYYPNGNESVKKHQNINISNSNYDQFLTTFPNSLVIEEGVPYDLYFEVFDNDAVNKNKSTKSPVFNYRKLTQSEEEQKQLKEQQQTASDFNKSLEKFDKQEKELQEISKTQKEKKELNFNDKKKFENFLKRQKQQDEMMKAFNKKLKDNLDEFQKDNPKDDQFKEDLKQRLKENEEQLKKDEKLIEEFEKLKDKLNKEQFSEKLDQLAKKAKSQKRSLKQLLEMTKRYYVKKKAEKISEELNKLADKQENLANEKEDKNTKAKQDEINKEFKKLQKELDALEKDNKALKKPLDISRKKENEEKINEQQQGASDDLKQKEDSQNQEQKKQKQQSAKKKQKTAAQKMRSMSKSMQKQMEGSAERQMQEDIQMLRQILDNLLVYSFDQEELMSNFKSIEVNHNEYAMHLKKQKELRTHFEHVDDSLFAISLRQPKFSEDINNNIHEVYYNVDKSLEELAENRIPQGTAAQQYALTSANYLADLLSGALDNLQNQMAMPSPGEGDGGMPMPDIIISQEELAKKMEEAMKKGEKESGKKPGKKPGDEPSDNPGDKPGDKSGDKPGDKQGDKPGDKPGKNSGNKGVGKGANNGKGQKSGKGNKEGTGPDGKTGKGKKGLKDGFSDDANGQLFKIYQEQQMLRQALEKRLDKEGLGENGSAKQLLNDMEDVELDLINQGLTNKTLGKMINLQHQLLKMKNAILEQGKEQKRKSKSNTQVFKNQTGNQLEKAKQYFNTTEILNKQTLPLQQIFKDKTKQYFKQQND